MGDRPRRSLTALDVEIDHQRIIYDTVDQTVRILDPIGAVVWSLLDGNASLNDLADDLSAAFHVPREQIAADVRSFVTMLQQNGLLADTWRAEPQPVDKALVLPNPPSP